MQHQSRTKTFTGCWTCRSRRLKCDERKPSCRQCTRRGLDCGGYSTRLQWLGPGDNEPGLRSDNTTGCRFQQRRLLPVATMDHLNDVQLDAALFEVEQSETGAHTYSSGPFSVFRIDREPNKGLEDLEEDIMADSPDSDIQSPLDPIPDGLSVSCPELEFKLGAVSSENIGNNNELSSQAEHSPVTASLELGGYSLVSQADAQRSGGLVIESGLDKQPGTELEAPVEQTLAIEPEIDTMFPEGQGQCQLTRQDQVATDLGRSRILFNPTFLTVQVRLLLDHYCQHVLPIFSILENGNTPWRYFHLARSFQCSSEMEIAGTSTAARKALLYAILACSAYNLHNRYICQEQSDAASCWARIAFDHRLQAVKCLRESVGTRDVASTNAEYKELLAAMLSMVTIDVISGDTRTCGIHLDGCESLIVAYLSHPSKSRRTSHTIRALHRIFFFLRSMQEGTLRMCDVAPTEFSDENSQARLQGRSDALLEELESTLAIDEHCAEPVNSSCELIYGVPPNLLALLRRACRLLSQKEHETTSSNLTLACEQLEEDILEWPINDAVRHVDIWPLSIGNKLILQHHMRAFHQAIIIFFCRRVERMHRRHVQQYVKTVIHHLLEIEKIKQEQHIWAGPVLWPAFVAASEAISQDTEAEILQWFELIEKHGVGTARHTREALQKLWRGKSSVDLYPMSAEPYESPLLMT